MNTSTNAPTEKTNSAIVIGGSITGLIAARVLVEHFDRVILLERDRLPEKPEFRPGVPQSLHVHALLTKGKEILAELFPGLSQELVANGALETDLAEDWRYLTASGWAPKFHSGMTMITCSRNLLENSIRRRLAEYRNLEFLEAHQATGLLLSNDTKSVIGVKVKSQEVPESKLFARLVVDASGRNSHTPQWLESFGYPKPQETVINSFLGYSSRWYKKAPEFTAPWKGIILANKPQDCSRGGVLYPVEDQTWIVTLAGIGKDYPPTDEADFLEFARSLRSSEIYETIKDAQPLSPIYGYRRTENRFRHYEKLPRFPENMIVMGDAACSFNPIYGQGMTVAALAGLTLRDCLKQQTAAGTSLNLLGLSRRFQRQLKKVNDVPWLMATSDDLRWSTTVGDKPDLQMRLTHKYIEKVIHSACHDNYVYQTFMEVAHMLEQPTALFSPKVLFKVLSDVA
ncbi:MAG: FAD-dependent monooxygenase [Cyanobacteria bacterium J06621_8]